MRDVAAILISTGLEPALLELEIHERLLIHDIDKTLQILTGLKALGVRIAIDNFGAGYSSLASLQQFPIDTIKIDRSFIRDVATPGKESDVTAAIISMGKSLSLNVVAQGVETKDQAEFLREHGCDEFQGFLFSEAVPSAKIASMLTANAHTRSAAVNNLAMVAGR